MKYLESLSLIKQKICSSQLADQKEELPEQTVIYSDANTSEDIDILSWIDSHGIELKDVDKIAKKVAKKENPKNHLEDLQEKLSNKKDYKKNQPVAIPNEKITDQKPDEIIEFEELQTIDTSSWIDEDESWNRSIDPDHWFQRSIEKQTDIVHEVSVERNDSFEDEHSSISESKEIMEHLDQHGISLKPADFEKKRVRGEVGVHRSKGAVEKTVDLHGMHVREAELKLIQTFEDSKIRGYQQILIVHGKGNHSSGGDSKMKRMVVDLLEGPLAEKVASFTFAPHNEGGGGASRVILK